MEQEKQRRETKFTTKFRPAPIVFDAYDEVFFLIRDIDRDTLVSSKFESNVDVPNIEGDINEGGIPAVNSETRGIGPADTEYADLRRELVRKDCLLRDLDIEYRKRELVLLNLRIARFEHSAEYRRRHCRRVRVASKEVANESNLAQNDDL